MSFLKTPLVGPIRGSFCAFIVFFLVVFSAFLVLNQIQNQTPFTDPKENQVSNQNLSPLTNRTEHAIGESHEGQVTRSGGEKNNGECDWFVGRWVYDNVTRPLYKAAQCKYMHEEVACDKYGRKDVAYQYWRWQPYSCDLPRFDAMKFLENIKGKRLVLVGDSVNRNQWASMACLIESVVPEEQKKRIYSNNLMSLIIKSHNVTIDFYWSPLLVESNTDNPAKHHVPTRIIRPDGFDKHAQNYINGDILVFNAYLWWTQHLPATMKVLYGSFEDPNARTRDIDMSEGYELVLQAWSQWLEKNVKNTNKQIFFMTLSPVHYGAEEWGGKQNDTCYGETEPVYKEGYRGNRSEYYLMQKLEDAVANLKSRGVDVQIIDISQLSEYRKDAHPSVYRKFYPTPYHDCTHWCLPGVPDVWNEFLYAYIVSKNYKPFIHQEGQIESKTPLEGQREDKTRLEEIIQVSNKPNEEKDECDWSIGRWVYDNVTRPLYYGSQCKYMHQEVACDKYGRKNKMYQQWRWQPHSCDLPRYNGISLLEKIRGKRLVFIGDSLNRNQWAAMACLIESVVPEEQKKRLYPENIMSLIVKSYNVTVDFYWSPLLVESNVDDPVNNIKPSRIMRALGMDKHAKNYIDADILVFNAHMWWVWSNSVMKILYGSFDDPNATTKNVTLMEGFEIALQSWSHWLEHNLKNTNKQIFFMTIPTTHNWAEDWGGEQNKTCHGETEPVYKEGYVSERSLQAHFTMTRKVEDVVADLKNKGVNVQIVDISRLSEYRKDAHPSIYRKFYPTPYHDCTHYCVPGVPDVWNELLFAYISSRKH